MEPFNVKISIDQTEVTLTILPTEENYFKVVYYGGVLGAVDYDQKSKNWKLVAPEKVTTGDLPPYSNVLDQNRVEIVLDSVTIVKIGIEIEKSGAFSQYGKQP